MRSTPATESHTFAVTVSGCSAEQAARVIAKTAELAERASYDQNSYEEVYDFTYAIGFGPLPEQAAPAPCEHARTTQQADTLVTCNDCGHILLSSKRVPVASLTMPTVTELIASLQRLNPAAKVHFAINSGAEEMIFDEVEVLSDADTRPVGHDHYGDRFLSLPLVVLRPFESDF